MFNYEKIPAQHMSGAVRRYIENRIEPGDFLKSLITNDLKRTFQTADSTNSLLIREWIEWFFNHAPADCWGSKEKFNAWMEGGEK